MKKLFIPIFIILTATLFYFTRETKELPSESEEITQSSSDKNAEQPSSTKNSQTSAQASNSSEEESAPINLPLKEEKKEEIPFDNSTAPAFIPETENEKSLEVLGTTVASIFKEDLRPDQLFDRLKREGLNPERVEKKSEYIGNQFVVTAPVGLKGTRYFKAIYESDDKGNYFPLHAFFEFQKSPNAFDRAVEFAKSQGNIKSIVASTDTYLNLKTTTDCQHIIVKKLVDFEEMQNHPENAYKKEDIGTVRVSLETNPRCD